MIIPILDYPPGRPQKYFALQRSVLKVFGVSFDGYKNWAYVTYSMLWITSLFITYTVIELYEVYCSLNDLNALVNNLSYLGTDILGVAKIAILLYHSKEIGKMFDNLEKGVFAPNTKRGGDVEEKLIKQCILINNRQTCLYYVTVVAAVGIGSVRTITKRLLYPTEKELPFTTFSWFDATHTPNYEVVWFYQSYWRMTYAFMIGSSDTLIAGILSHISIQFKILQNAIRRLIENAYNEVFPSAVPFQAKRVDPSQIPWKIVEKYTKEIIDYHESIVQLAERFEKLFNLLLLCVFMATLFILCFIMYRASMVNLISVRAAEDFSYVGVVTLQVFLYCFWGNEVRLESERVADACWETNFVGADVRFQKALVLIIKRSQKAIVITAGKFADLSLSTYAGIIRASYSYYMVLVNHNKAQRVGRS